MHVMGTFHKHHITGRCHLHQLFRCFLAGITGYDILHACLFCTFGKETGKRSHRNQTVKSDFSGFHSCFIMQFFFKAAQFAHITEHKEIMVPCNLLRRAESHFHGQRVGIIRIVKNGDAPYVYHRLPLIGRAELTESLLDFPVSTPSTRAAVVAARASYTL